MTTGAIRNDLVAAADQLATRDPEMSERLLRHADRLREARAAVMEGSIEFALLLLQGAPAAVQADPRVRQAMVALGRHVSASNEPDPRVALQLELLTALAPAMELVAARAGRTLVTTAGRVLAEFADRHALDLQGTLQAEIAAGRWPRTGWPGLEQVDGVKDDGES